MNAPSPCVLRPGRMRRGGWPVLPTWPVGLREAGALRKQHVVWCPWLQHGSVSPRGRRPRLGKPREQTGLWVPLTAPPRLPASGVLACTLGATVSLGTRPSVASRAAPASGLPITGYKGSGRLPRRWEVPSRPGPQGRAVRPQGSRLGPLVQAGPVLAPLLSPRPRHRRLALSSVLSDGPLPGHPQTCPPGGGKRAWDGSAGGVWPRHPQGCPCHSLCGRREPSAAPGTGCSPNPHGPAGRGGPGRRRLAGQGTVVGGHGCLGEGWGRFGVCVGSHSRAQRQAAVGRGVCVSGTCCCAADTGHSRGPVRGPQAGPSPPLGREKWGKQGQL